MTSPSSMCSGTFTLVGIYLIALGPEFIYAWIQDRSLEGSGKVAQLLMLSFLAFLPARAVAVPLLLGLDKGARPAIGMLVMGVVKEVQDYSLTVSLPSGLEGTVAITQIADGYTKQLERLTAGGGQDAPEVSYNNVKGEISMA